GPSEHRPEQQDLQERARRSAHVQVVPAARQRAPVGECRTVCGQVKDHVVAAPAGGEVFPGVVDDAAPRERMNSSFSALSTPVTPAPASLASWMAYIPEPPPAPLTSTCWPGCTPPLSWMPCSAMAPAWGRAAACS